MLQWAPHIRCVRLGDDLVLLDVAADEYACVRDGVAALGASPDGRSLSPASETLAQELQAAGVVIDGPAPAARAAAEPLRPTRDLRDEAAVAPTAGDVMRLLASLLDLAVRYRGRSLGQILRFVRPGFGPVLQGARDHTPRQAPERTPEQNPEQNPERPAPPAADLVRRVKAFEALCAWAPAPRKCLARSFLLLRFLQRSGCDARWIFGVSTWPFAAHCWLQVGDTVLDEAPERLAAYEPILAV